MVECPYGVIYHEVVPGDTIWLIANKYGTTMKDIVRLNSGINPSRIWPGMSLRICPNIPPEQVR